MGSVTIVLSRQPGETHRWSTVYRSLLVSCEFAIHGQALRIVTDIASGFSLVACLLLSCILASSPCAAVRTSVGPSLVLIPTIPHVVSIFVCPPRNLAPHQRKISDVSNERESVKAEEEEMNHTLWWWWTSSLLSSSFSLVEDYVICCGVMPPAYWCS
jgi:hypothetical protein